MPIDGSPSEHSKLMPIITRFHQNLAKIWEEPKSTRMLSLTLDRILDEVIAVFPFGTAVSAAIYTYHPHTGFQNRAVLGILRDYLTQNPPREYGTVARSTKLQQAIFVNNVQSSSDDGSLPKLSDAAITAGIQAYANIPLITRSHSENKVIGIFVINFLEPYPFTEQEKNLLLLLADFSATAIGSVEILNKSYTQQEQLERESQIWQKLTSSLGEKLNLNEVGMRLLSEVRGIISYENASVQWIVDDTRYQIAGSGFSEDPPKIVLQPVSQDKLVQAVFDGLKPLIIPITKDNPLFDSNTLPNVQSWVGIPLIYASKPIGIITLDHSVPNHYLTQNIDTKRLTAFAEYAARTLTETQLETEIKVKIRELTLVNEVTDKISRELNVDIMRKQVVESVINHLDCKHCAYFEPKSDDSNSDVWLEPLAFADREVPDRKIQRKFKVGEKSLVAYAYQNRKIVCVTDASKNPWFAKRTDDKLEPLSMLLAPIEVSGRVVGVISADDDRLGWFGPWRERVIATLAQQVGIALHYGKQLTLLRKISEAIVSTQPIKEVLPLIVRGALELVGCDTGILYLVDEKWTITESFPYPLEEHIPEPRLSARTGITYRLMTEKKTLVIDDLKTFPGVNEEVKERYSSFIGLPLITTSGAIGVLYLNSIDPRKFSNTEISLLETLVNNAVIGVENARKQGQVETRLREVTEELTRTQDIAIRTSLAAELVHTVQSPASNIQAFVGLAQGLLSKDSANLSKLAAYLSTINWDAEQIRMRANELRELPQKSNIDIAFLLRKLSYSAQRRTKNVVCNLPVKLPTIYAVENILSYAIWNIIENGIDSMDGKGTLTIHASLEVPPNKDEKLLTIDISDQGTGISPEALPVIFDIHRSKPKAMQTNKSGIGYGLIFSKFNIENLGGTLTVLNTSRNGTTFRISLPVR